MGDHLVVSVTADEFVQRGPGRPVFNQGPRLETIAALSCVDYVALSEDSSALPIINALRPDFYCKGREYADPAADLTANFRRERERVEELGGKVELLGGAVHSSTQLLNRHFDVLPELARSFVEDFRTRYRHDDIRRIVEGLSQLSVLVVGEVIVDEYINCQMEGVTVKDHVPAVREFGRDRQWGGSYAVARHLAEFCGTVTLTGIASPEDPLMATEPPPDASESVAREFVTDPGARTIVKQRYVVENELRAELDKVFAVHHTPGPESISSVSRDLFRGRLRELMACHDFVVVTDYGHGLLDQATMDVLQHEAPSLALNCQTNSSNYGFNLITKYRQVDTFCLDQVELALAFRVPQSENWKLLLQQLREQLGARTGWLTLGAEGAISVGSQGEVHEIPALTLDVRDTLGAGDAFFSLASACAAKEEPLEVSAFVGNAAGALAVNITGNTYPVKKVDLLKFAWTVLNV